MLNLKRFMIIYSISEGAVMHNKLEHTAYITYTVCICVALIFIVYIYNNLKNDVYNLRSTNGYVTLTPEAFTTIEDSDCPLGVYNTA